jgi:hypothetical protein
LSPNATRPDAINASLWVQSLQALPASHPYNTRECRPLHADTALCRRPRAHEADLGGRDSGRAVDEHVSVKFAREFAASSVNPDTSVCSTCQITPGNPGMGV